MNSPRRNKKFKWLKYSAIFSVIIIILLIVIIKAFNLEYDSNDPVSNSPMLNGAGYVTAFRAINALDSDEKVRNPDYLAEKFLSDAFWERSGMYLDFSVMREIAKEGKWVAFTFINARTHHIDRLLKKEAANGLKQVVVLGAGLDSRAYRFRESMPQVHFFEVDLPGMIKQKKEKVKKIFGTLPSNVTYAPIDFNKETLKTVLGKTGYKASLKTYFIFEGVTMYISEEGVSSTINFISQNSAPGSSVVFDYMVKSVIEGNCKSCPNMREQKTLAASRGEPFIFGLEKDEAKKFVNQRGLKVLSDAGGKELTKRYLVRSDGKVDCWLTDCWRMMHAAVQ